MRSNEQLCEDFDYILRTLNIKSVVFIRVYDVARVLNVSERQACKLVSDGLIKGYKTSSKSANAPYQVFIKDLKSYFIEVNTVHDLKKTLK